MAAEEPVNSHTHGPWHEIYDDAGNARPAYRELMRRLGGLGPSQLRSLDERMEAVLREMGVSFGFGRGGGHRSWGCDILPHVFMTEEWERVERGFRQRLKAFEMFLHDVYGGKEILRSGTVPVQPVLGSPHYQPAATGLPRPLDAFLHLSGICLARGRDGRLAVKHHHFAHASGISYMMQNRRALVRVLPEIFHDTAVEPLAETPLLILERLRDLGASGANDISVVLLSSGTGSPVYSEHSFLGRRMGIPVVQGGDMLVLDDHLYLKTVGGLDRVEVLYNRVADAWLDPLVFNKHSLLGIPGLVHCIRKGTVALINGIGSQLADDRSLLAFAPKIIRYYLNEAPVLPQIPTHWLGDIDAREMVLDDFAGFHVRPLFGDGLSGADGRVLTQAQVVEKIRRDGGRFVAQPREFEARTVCFDRGKMAERGQEHIVFAMRSGGRFDVFPGALTRIALDDARNFDASWTTRDSWVPGDSAAPALSALRVPHTAPVRQVTSRVADAFYWLGRYLERAYHQAYLIQAIEMLETEELNSAERKLYRPMWNRLLPPIEAAEGERRRGIANRLDRYRLVLQPEAGSIVSIFNQAFTNAGSIQECLSPEAWSSLSSLRLLFQRTKYKTEIGDEECARVARRVGEAVTGRVPQFFATASGTMLADDGWRFCKAGQLLERAVITANSVLSVSKALTGEAQTMEIELSAFLRLLGTRDAYRRVYQMRAEAVPVLEFLWQNPEAPRAVLRCLARCAQLLRESAPAETPGTRAALAAIDALIHRIRRTDWVLFVNPAPDEETPAGDGAPENLHSHELAPLLAELLDATAQIHGFISDGFFSHQAHIAQVAQPLLLGF
jgi:uncharacterized circularly permuted ATP-grasp superfamily protein/uncharacterized alpha-E superfamily protein